MKKAGTLFLMLALLLRFTPVCRAEQEITLVSLGVSIAWGYGCQPEEAYGSLLADYIGGLVMPAPFQVRYVNYGTDGDTAADLLEEKGISAEIIKLNTIVPLDVDAVAASVEKTGGFLVLEDCVENGSVGQRLTAELAKQNALPRTILLKNLGNAYTAQGSVSLLRKAKALDGASVAAAVEEALGHGEKAT